ncbi:MAG: acyltransferase [Ilumatobacteraceae bacterium]
MSRPAPATSALDHYAPSLDGLRGVCIAGVVAFHACSFNGYTATIPGGFIGVSVFFTLSGFLITSLLLREIDSNGRVGLANFWARRIRRLWPAALTVTLLVLVLSITEVFSARSADVVAATWNVTNWHVIVAGQDKLLQTIVGPLGPTWSLAVEEQFYIVLALLMAAVAGHRRAPQILLAVAAVGIVVPSVLSNVVTDWEPALEFNTVFCLPQLFGGVALAVWYRSDRSWRPAPPVADAMAAAGLLAMVGLFVFADKTPPWLLRGGYLAVTAVTAATILGLLHGTRLPALMSVGPLRGLGTISYPLYLVHGPVITLMTRDRLDLDPPQRIVISVAVAVAVAWALHVAVERPVRRSNTAPTPTIIAGLAAALGLTVAALVAL